MENAETENKEKIPEAQDPQQEVAPLALEREDVGNLEQVLRGYYLSQIKNLEVRKDRKLARKLLENHLVLPKSRQRTSKDAAYIREILGIEGVLLDRLEDSRLIRRIDKTGTNPIYEISHDTLVEPILAERSNREAIALFLKKYAPYFLLLLLLLFGLGMFFENNLDLLDDSLSLGSRSQTQQGPVVLQAQDRIYVGPGNAQVQVKVPFADLAAYKKMDSLMLDVGVNITVRPESADGAGQEDTLFVDLGAMALDLPVSRLQALIQAGKDTAIPLRLTLPIGIKPATNNAEGSAPLMASVEGTTVLHLQQERGGLEPRQPLASNERLAPGARRGNERVQVNLGRKKVQAQTSLRPVALDTVISLAGLFPEDQALTDLLRDKQLQLTYGVDVLPVDDKPAKRVEVEVLTSPDAIQVQTPNGPRIYKIDPSGTNASQAAKVGYYEVQENEGLLSVAKKFNTTMQEIRDLNGMLKSQTKLTPGQRIIVPLE